MVLETSLSNNFITNYRFQRLHKTTEILAFQQQSVRIFLYSRMTCNIIQKFKSVNVILFFIKIRNETTIDFYENIRTSLYPSSS